MLRSISRRQLYAWQLTGAVLTLAVLAAGQVFRLRRLGLIGGLLGAVLTLVVVPLEWRGLRYRIGRECLRVSGVLVRRTTLLPLDRVTEVRIVAGPVDRLFGVRSVLLRTPGASLLLPGLTGEEAAALAALALEGGGEG